MKVNFQLLILSMNHTKRSPFWQVLITDKQVPIIEFTGELSIQQTLSKTIEEYLEINSVSCKPNLVDIEYGDDTLTIIYGVMIPDFIKIKIGGWIQLEDIINAEHDLQKYCKYIFKATS